VFKKTRNSPRKDNMCFKLELARFVWIDGVRRMVSKVLYLLGWAALSGEILWNILRSVFLPSSGSKRKPGKQTERNVSGKHIASIFRVEA
jgi:hypothetical protein